MNGAIIFVWTIRKENALLGCYNHFLANRWCGCVVVWDGVVMSKKLTCWLVCSNLQETPDNAKVFFDIASSSCHPLQHHKVIRWLSQPNKAFSFYSCYLYRHYSTTCVSYKSKERTRKNDFLAENIDLQTCLLCTLDMILGCLRLKNKSHAKPFYY